MKFEPPLFVTRNPRARHARLASRAGFRRAALISTGQPGVTNSLPPAAVEARVAPKDISAARRGTFIVYAAQAPSGLPKQLRAREGYARRRAQIDLSRLPVEMLGVTLTGDFAPVDRPLADLWLYGEE